MTAQTFYRPRALLFALLPAISLAQIVVNNGTIDWTNPAGWSTGRVPGGADSPQISTGTVTVTGNVSVTSINLFGGAIGGMGTLTLTSTGSEWRGGNFNSGTGGTLAVASGATLAITTTADHDFNARAIVNRGTITWSAGYLRSGNGGSITNAPGGIFNTTGNGYSLHVPSSFGGTFRFTNQGSFNRSGAGSTPLDVPFDNSGLVNVTGGTLSLNAGGTSGGMFTVTGTGSSLVIANSYALTAGATLNGPVRVTGGTLTATGSITVDGLAFEGGSLAGTQTFLGGIIDWTGGNWNAAATTTLAAGSTLNLGNGADHDFNARSILNQGTVNWSSGYLRAGSGSVFTNATGATFNDLNASSYTIHTPSAFGGAFSFVNQGTYRRSTTGTTSFNIPFTNSGAIDVQKGTLEFRAGGSFTSTGMILAAAGAAVTFNSDFTLVSGSALTGAGTYSLVAGTLTVPTGTLAISTFNQTGGTLAGAPTLSGIYNWHGGNWNAPSALTTTLAAGSTLNLGNGADHDFNARSILNQGTVNWSSGYLRAGNGSVFTNATGATFNDLNASGYTIHNPSGFGGTFSFINDGSYLKTTTGTTAIDIPFTNTGRILVSAGTLVFNGTFTNSGGTLIASGGSFSFSTPLVIGTGTLGGTGTITAASVIAAGPVAPGNSPGQLTLTGDLTLLATSTLLIELAGPAKGVSYDFLSVGGSAALAGNFSISFLSGFQNSVAPADTFTVVTASNLTGAFANVAHGQRLITSDGLGSFLVNYGSASAFNPGSIVLTNFVPIPEPSTYALMGLGLIVLVVASRRRGKS